MPESGSDRIQWWLTLVHITYSTRQYSQQQQRRELRLTTGARLETLCVYGLGLNSPWFDLIAKDSLERTTCNMTYPMTCIDLHICDQWESIHGISHSLRCTANTRNECCSTQDCWYLWTMHDGGVVGVRNLTFEFTEFRRTTILWRTIPGVVTGLRTRNRILCATATVLIMIFTAFTQMRALTSRLHWSASHH